MFFYGQPPRHDDWTVSSLRFNGFTLRSLPFVLICLRADGDHTIVSDVEQWLDAVKALFAIAPATLLAIPGMMLSLNFYAYGDIDPEIAITVPLFPPMDLQ